MLWVIGMLLVCLFANMASALAVNSVDYNKFYPGDTTDLKVELKNSLNYDVEDVSLTLNLANTQFTTSGSSEDNVDGIDEDDEETFNFELKAVSSAVPGDYNIPYTISYLDDSGDEQTKTGTIGITLSAKTELEYGIETEGNIVGQQGKIAIKITNRGLANVGFVSVSIGSSNGFEFLDVKEEYIGEVSSDDYETANFNVLFKSTSASLTAVVKYKDFDNKEQTETIPFSVSVYSREKALELGLIKKPNYWIYIIIVLLLVIWFVWRRIKKSRANKRKMEEARR